MVNKDTLDKAVAKISPSLREIIDKEREKYHLEAPFKIKDIKEALADASGNIKIFRDE